MKTKNRILVIDDNPDMLKGNIHLLQSAGYEVMGGASGNECLKIVRDVKPDLILLDVNLPDIDGTEVCRRIKADPALQDIFIAHLSAKAISSESQVSGLAAGADAYLTVPISNKELLARLQALLRLKNTLKTLKQNEDFLTVTLRSISNGIIVIDTEATVLLLNEAAETITGWHQEEAIGKPFADIFVTIDENTRLASTIPLEDVVEQNATIDLSSSHMLIARDGSERILSGSAKPITEKNSTVTGIVLTFGDITQQRETEKEKEKLIDELKKALEEVKTLSGLLPICSGCKKIRDDKGYWNKIESYIMAHSEAEFTHSLCPECLKRLYPDLY